jgi:hypothetical protein
MPTFKVQEDPTYGLVTKVGSIQLEYGVREEELQRELVKSMGMFIRAMEQQGMMLYEDPRLDNPQWAATADGEMSAFYAIDWLDDRPANLGPDGEPLPRTRESSLEDTLGMVEYRCVGVFWAPDQMVEALKSKQAIVDEERLERNPLLFGYGGAGGGSRMVVRDPDQVAKEQAEGELL